MQNYVFIIDVNKQPLNPIRPKRARTLLMRGKAAVIRMYPFTLILKTVVENPVLRPVELKIDPGSKVTGLALVQDGEVVWGANLEHRGAEIKSDLESRSAVRKSRRNRKTRYRKARFLNRKRTQMWLPPSLMHRVLTIETWVKRLCRYVPVTGIVMELVRFDTQALQNPEITGQEYQQGKLFGYEVKEYLLAKWGRNCVYCGKQDVPLQVEHIHPKSNGGSDRISNLTITCVRCNQKKGSKSIEDFLKKKPDLLRQIKVVRLAPLKDAAAVNSTRWKLYQSLKKISGLNIATSTGGRTKYNRIKNGFDKDHWIDACCVGESGLGVILKTKQAMMIKSTGVGSGRQMTRTNKFGFPCAKPKQRYQHGWKTGDIARFIDGTTTGRIVVQSASRLEIRINKQRIGGQLNKFSKLHSMDGYNYAF
ncbi:MAG: RRXRR domain-containing protein [Brasilonema octagenarum HA4186-MV1]|jgi:5-methylcytosine-specific restriction endonuclease McrA|uniref:HNH endonuclease n=1 Tax=Brasilonema sennae CENA114 TaxID=415709 RepID=A0A856M9J4_9CYAN|nr:RNA-guided endonuclease IscB [Brasilonema sennae]MBW4628404.1 RRXRR domain-containing protein [Brasilonema octagenarum HA4186-MV1]QDL07030.1 HNH endonuclease [Brasilonema sennae CENA114]QDL13392.1 HNH endonuclease [Brasilonema octagenarum UFV-E1]